ncbi:MAG: hypothetical protein WC459_03975 [Patescibacteria group bacterium]
MKMTNKGKIIIIEGIWSSGKTTLAKLLSKKLKAKFLREPNHITSGVKSKDIHYITSWYLKAHKANFDLAVILASRGENIIIERSTLYNIAFQRIVLGDKKTSKIFAQFMHDIRHAVRGLGLKIKFIYLIPGEIAEKASLMKKKKNIKRFAKQDLLVDIDNELKNLLKKMHGSGLINLQSK